jgi:hypothetical protein
MDIIVSRFNEDTSWTDGLTANLFLYDKSELKITGSIPLENEGRESDTYLEHVLKNYKHIKNPCVFLQGNPFDHCPSVIDHINSYRGGLVWLGKTYTSDVLGAPEHSGLPIGDVADSIGLDHNGSFEFVAGAQYIVPPENIKNKPISWWKKLKKIHDSVPNAPWVFERLWPLIFS